MKLISVFLISLLVGCAATKNTVVKVPVYEKLPFDMPVRPTLISNGGNYDQVTKNLEIDCISLMKYSTELETILLSLKK